MTLQDLQNKFTQLMTQLGINEFQKQKHIKHFDSQGNQLMDQAAQIEKEYEKEEAIQKAVEEAIQTNQEEKSDSSTNQ